MGGPITRPTATPTIDLVKGVINMSTYTPTELIEKWARGELAEEQAIGHLMQQIQVYEREIAQLKKKIADLQEFVNQGNS